MFLTQVSYNMHYSEHVAWINRDENKTPTM